MVFNSAWNNIISMSNLIQSIFNLHRITRFVTIHLTQACQFEVFLSITSISCLGRNRFPTTDRLMKATGWLARRARAFTRLQIDRVADPTDSSSRANVSERSWRRRRSVGSRETSAHHLDKSFSNDGQTNYFWGVLLTRFRALPSGPFHNAHVSCPKFPTRLWCTPFSDRSSDSYVFFSVETRIKV